MRSRKIMKLSDRRHGTAPLSMTGSRALPICRLAGRTIRRQDAIASSGGTMTRCSDLPWARKPGSAFSTDPSKLCGR